MKKNKQKIKGDSENTIGVVKRFVIPIICILLGLCLFIGTLFFSKKRKQHMNVYESQLLLVSVAGEGFEHVCNPVIDVNFNSEGESTLIFRRHDEDAEDIYAWVSIVSLYPYEWSIHGDINHVEASNDEYSILQDKTGRGGFVERFRVGLKHAFNYEYIEISIDPEYATYQTRYVRRVLAPYIYESQPYTSDSYDTLNSVVDIIDEMPKMTEEEEKEFGNSLMKNTMAVGKMGDLYLSPALVEINPSYYYPVEDLLEVGYELRIAPDNYNQDIEKIKWDTEQGQFAPSIEYVETSRYDRESKVIDVIYLLSTFIISMAAVELIKAVIVMVGRKRRK